MKQKIQHAIELAYNEPLYGAHPSESRNLLPLPVQYTFEKWAALQAIIIIS